MGWKTRMAGSGGGYCCYCKRGPLEPSTSRSNLAFTRDHVNPKANGGGKTVPCCRKCNNLKSDLHPREWFWFIDHHPRWWKEFRNHAEVARVVAAERVRRTAAGEPPIAFRVLPPLTDHELEGIVP